MYASLLVLVLYTMISGQQQAGVMAVHLGRPEQQAGGPLANSAVSLAWTRRTGGGGDDDEGEISASANIFSHNNFNLKPSRLDTNRQLQHVLYRTWRRRRQLELMERRRRANNELIKLATPVDEVHDTRPAYVRQKRDSRFGKYSTRMFQSSQTSAPVPQPKSQMLLHPKFYPPSSPLPSSVASPSLTSARQRLGFEQRGSMAAESTPPAGHSSVRPKEKLHDSATVQLSHPKPMPPASARNNHTTVHSNNNSNSVKGVVQQHNNHTSQQLAHNHHNGHHRNGFLPQKGRKYCSARDPANLAFEAGVVFEGKVRSMSTHNYSVTFQVLKVHKMQPGFPQIPSHIRIHFKQVKNLDCDIHLDNFRSPAHVRGRLDQGKAYFIFGKFVELNNFTLIGQPMRSSEKHMREVRNGLSESYGEYS